MGNATDLARASAERCIPHGIDNRAARVSAYVDGYMAGRAAIIRSANKRWSAFHEKAIEELKIVEREIGVPSEALKIWSRR